jgi:hypothetical protein
MAGMERLGQAWCGEVWRGKAGEAGYVAVRSGEAGRAWQGMARLGWERSGIAGEAWRGMFRFDTVRQALFKQKELK